MTNKTLICVDVGTAVKINDPANMYHGWVGQVESMTYYPLLNFVAIRVVIDRYEGSSISQTLGIDRLEKP